MRGDLLPPLGTHVFWLQNGRKRWDLRSWRCLIAVLATGLLMSACEDNFNFDFSDIEFGPSVAIEWTNPCEAPVTIELAVRSPPSGFRAFLTQTVEPGDRFSYVYTAITGEDQYRVWFPEMGYHEVDPGGTIDRSWTPQPPLDRCPDGDYVRVEWTNKCQTPVTVQLSSRTIGGPPFSVVLYPAATVEPGDAFEGRIYLRNQGIAWEQDQVWQVALLEMGRSSARYSEAQLRERGDNPRWIIEPHIADCPGERPSE